MPFAPENTQMAQFMLLNGSTANVAMMQQDAAGVEFLRLQECFNAIRLPFKVHSNKILPL